MHCMEQNFVYVTPSKLNVSVLIQALLIFIIRQLDTEFEKRLLHWMKFIDYCIYFSIL